MKRAEQSPATLASLVSTRADELFRINDAAVKQRTDRLFAYLLMGQWAFAILLAVTVSPSAWQGRTSSIHSHVLIAVGLGGLLNAFPLLLVFVRPGSAATRYVIAVAQMLWSGLLVHLTGGRLETHFHIFGSLAFLAFYRDWKTLVPATLVVTGDHLVRQLFWPESIFGISSPETWRFLEHAGWVLFEDVFLAMACLAGIREMKGFAYQQARVESTHRVEEEMAIASRIQTSILPRTFTINGLDVSAKMLPATEVGGDYYDVMRVDGGAWIGIGDVAGHGLKAGLVMMQAQSAIGALVSRNPESAPRDVLRDVNNVLFENIRNRLEQDEHMTISLLRYYEDGRLVFAGAHEEMVIYRAATGRCEQVSVKGTWLGVRQHVLAHMVERTVLLAKEDVVVLYTDGVTEARDAAGEMFGIDRLRGAIEGAGSRSPEAIRDHVLAKVHDWTHTQKDDVTLVILRHMGIAEQAAA